MNKIAYLLSMLILLTLVNCAREAPAEQKPKTEESQALDAEASEENALDVDDLEAELSDMENSSKELDDVETKDSTKTNMRSLKKIKSSASESAAPATDPAQDADFPQESKDQRGGTVITTNN